MKYRTVKLKEIADIVMGQSPKSDFYNTDGVGTPFLQGVRTFGDNYPIIDTYTTSFNREASAGQILFSVRAPVGRVNWATQNIAIGRGLAAIKVKSGYSKDYLYYLFKKIGSRLDSLSTGTVFTSINKKELEELSLKIPSELTNQERIANYLKKLDLKIDLNNQINDNLNFLLKYNFDNYYHESGDKNKKLEFIAEVGSSNRIFAKEYRNEGVPFLRGKEISLLSQGTTPTDTLFISFERYQQLKNIPNTKDILITSVGTIGNVYQVEDFRLPFYYKDGNIIRITPKKGFENYIYLWLKSKFGDKEIVKATIGSTQKALTISSIKKFKLFIPNSRELKKFNSIVNPLIYKIQQIHRENEVLQELKSILLNKYF